MLTILATTSHFEEVKSTINSVDRLSELVKVIDNSEETQTLKNLIVSQNEIKSFLDWFDTEPPYLIPSQPFSKENLLAMVFLKLGNHQRAFEYLEEETELFNHFLASTNLHFGYRLDEGLFEFITSTSSHNFAISHYYNSSIEKRDLEVLKGLFKHSLSESSNDEEKAFTLKHYVNFLLDLGRKAEAKRLLEKNRVLPVSNEGKLSFDLLEASIEKEELNIPYDSDRLEAILQIQLKGIEAYESFELNTQAGLLLMEASEIANFKEDFITSKQLINKAIQYFKEEDIPEFLGEAGLKKAVLLYTWSKNGSPQYYKAAINAFQDVLKVFKRDTHPQQFADVHHNLALIYSEIPVSAEEQPMWTAFCASSFKEVLSFYAKENFPYEHAMASHNYATALMDFPPAKIHDNLTKAKGLFDAALEIRKPDTYPFERALTLLNVLELGWLSHNEDSIEEIKKYEEMKSQAEEIQTLVSDPALIEKAEEHLQRLEQLKTLIDAK
ncbi:MAG: hypothetical protein MK086_08340 [Flavobacteriales bacterium]|nr:hypothetical protein [Flavobacteriales bacterium]